MSTCLFKIPDHFLWEMRRGGHWYDFTSGCWSGITASIESILTSLLYKDGSISDPMQWCVDRWPVESPCKRRVTRNAFPCPGTAMYTQFMSILLSTMASIIGPKHICARPQCVYHGSPPLLCQLLFNLQWWQTTWLQTIAGSCGVRTLISTLSPEGTEAIPDVMIV